MVEQLNSLSERLGAKPYLVNAYPVTPANITIELPEFDPNTYTDAVRGHHLTAMKALRQNMVMMSNKLSLNKGCQKMLYPNLQQS